MSTEQELNEVRAKIRIKSWSLKSILIRQAARATFDLPQFGTGALERIGSSMVFCALFFFLFLFIGHVVKLAGNQQVSTNQVLGLAAFAFMVAVATSVVLILWSSDEDLEVRGNRLRDELNDLREQEVDLKETLEMKRIEDEAEERSKRRNVSPYVRCEFCQEKIRRHAVKCIHCGEYLDDDLREQRRGTRPRRFNPAIAGILSFFWPGTGQLYKGQPMAWFIWSSVIPVCYCCFVVPGIVLHMICVFDAMSSQT